MVTKELISWITLPASFVTFTVRVKGSPARADDGETDASRWKPLEIARTCVVLPVLEGFVTSETEICWKPPVERRMERSTAPFTIGASAGSCASGSLDVMWTTSVGPDTGFHQASVAMTVTVKA